ncbi:MULTISPECIES: hypothetical protein [unclassified Rhodococcus (in: high G+C Gram-positive bacteria)]|nr:MULTISPECIES: hypothetical protein [unclassified Rhodococcus (in: high G+C Gram-positive bacteria)]
MTAPDPAATDPLTAADEQADPRLARSRNRLLDAAGRPRPTPSGWPT